MYVEKEHSELLGTVYTIKNETQSVQLSPLGARLLSWNMVVEQQNRDIIVGFDSLKDHEKYRYFGATIGPVAGRIAKGTFTIDDATYKVEIDDTGHILHSGQLGLDKIIFDAQIIDDGVLFSTIWTDETNHFPGVMTINVMYHFTEKNELQISYEATTTHPTLFNPTNHAYFNLLGDPSLTINDHYLTVAANKLAQTNQELITTGELIELTDTVYDFTTKKQIGTLALDDPFILHHQKAEDLCLESPDGAICLTVKTDAPAIILYTTGEHEVGQKMKHNQIMTNRGAIAIETQGIPGSEQHAHFPSIILYPETPFHSTTTYRVIEKKLP